MFKYKVFFQKIEKDPNEKPKRAKKIILRKLEKHTWIHMTSSDYHLMFVGSKTKKGDLIQVKLPESKREDDVVGKSIQDFLDFDIASGVNYYVEETEPKGLVEVYKDTKIEVLDKKFNIEDINPEKIINVKNVSDKIKDFYEVDMDNFGRLYNNVSYVIKFVDGNTKYYFIDRFVYIDKAKE